MTQSTNKSISPELLISGSLCLTNFIGEEPGFEFCDEWYYSRAGETASEALNPPLSNAYKEP